MRVWVLVPVAAVLVGSGLIVGWWFVPLAYLWVGTLIRLFLMDPSCGPVVTWRVVVGWAWGLVDDRGVDWTRPR